MLLARSVRESRSKHWVASTTWRTARVYMHMCMHMQDLTTESSIEAHMAMHACTYMHMHMCMHMQDLTTESSIEAHMARGVPVFLLLMPDEYEESLGEIMGHLRTVPTPGSST